MRIETGAPLSIQITKPFMAVSIGEAVNAAIAQTGYRLVDGVGEPTEQAQLLRLPMPIAHQNLAEVRVIDALVTLGGPAYHVVVDHVHRLVGFELKPKYQHYQAASRTDTRPNTAVGLWQCTTRQTKSRCFARVRS